MMTKLGSRKEHVAHAANHPRVAVLAALMFAMAAVACTAQPVTDLGGARSASSDDEDEPKTKSSKHARSVEEDEDLTEDVTSATEATEDTAPPAIDMTFAASAGQTFGNVPIHRACSDMGADYNQATVVDGTSLALVDVYTKQVLLTVDGAELDAIKDELANGAGKLHIPVAAGQLPAESTEYAIVMSGDKRFGSPAKCGVDIAPKSEKDRGVKGGAGHFPTGRTIVATRAIAGDGCGIVGFMQAYEDASTGEIYARPTSPIVIAGDDEGRAGFPKGAHYPGCDTHSSPLVLDLGGRGVSLSKSRADVFDIDGNGTRDAMSWVSSDDTPFLVRDANGNGVVDGATELFGNYTDRASANGFEALSHFDDLGDGVIDRHDRVWSTLRLWFDRNHDGRTDAGELETLESRGVTSIATRYVSTSEKLMSGGSLEGAVRQRGAATTSDGRTIPVLDVWFERRF